jgi:hypothetical protein
VCEELIADNEVLDALEPETNTPCDPLMSSRVKIKEYSVFVLPVGVKAALLPGDALR